MATVAFVCAAVPLGRKRGLRTGDDRSPPDGEKGACGMTPRGEQAIVAETGANAQPVFSAIFSAPIGEILLVADESGLRELQLPGSFAPPEHFPAPVRGCLPLNEAVEQLAAYFAGDLTRFDLPLVLRGTDFQLRVWRALADIPYAKTESYGSVAARIGNAKASRAVGMANNRNPLAIVLPCHRVIGSDGALVGYGGGLWMKEWLLRHEAAVLERNGAEPV